MLRQLVDVVRAVRHGLGLGPHVDLFFREKFENLRAYYGGRILDFGAGTCHFAKQLQDVGYSVTAVDVVDQNRYPDVTLNVVEGPRLPYANGAFETSVVHFVLHHIERQREALAECIRVTRGTLIISEDVVDSWWDQVMAWLHTGSSEWARAWSGFRSTRGWLEFFGQFPVDVVEQRVIPRWRTPYYPVRRAVFVLRVRAMAST